MLLFSLSLSQSRNSAVRNNCYDFRFVNVIFLGTYVTIVDALFHIQSLQNKIQFSAGNKPFDYISVTPPYMEVDYAVLMEQISNSALVGEDSFIVSHDLFMFFYVLMVLLVLH